MNAIAKHPGVLDPFRGGCRCAQYAEGTAAQLQDSPIQAAQQPGWDSIDQQVSLAHEAEPGAARCFVHVGGAHQHGNLVITLIRSADQPDDQLPEILARDRVYPSGRLIEQEKTRAVSQRGCQAQLLLHPSRKMTRPTVEETI